MKKESILLAMAMAACCAFGQAVRPQVVQPMPINRRTINSGTGTMPAPTLQQMPEQQRAVDAASTSAGSYTPFMLSLVAPLQVPPGAYDVGGLKLDLIYGDCYDFDGLDLGLFSRTRGHANGFQAGGLAIVDGDGVGCQINCLANIVWGEYDGLQIGVANHSARGQVFQIGAYNGGDQIQGCQIGVINFAREMVGVQIGLVNVIQNKDVPFLPIVNAYF